MELTKTLQTPADKLHQGRKFANRYKIVRTLGRGGMGEVYRAVDEEVKEDVAIKLIRKEIANDEDTIERFRNELKVARKVSHRNVCRMFDLNRAEEGYFITMEFVDGEDLKTSIRKKRPAIDRAIEITRQVCEGLAEAHRMGVVHRDLKPQNIIIDKDGQAKIMDFGIARSLEAPGMTATGVIIGTPDYISPEQAEGKSADKRSDLYSLGVILYEMVTGGLPFEGDSAFSMALKHKTQLPQNPRKLNPKIPESLNRLILICLEKNRERRYQTAEELLADLKNVEHGVPLGTKLLPKRKSFLHTFSRKKLFLPAAGLILAVIAAAMWLILPKGESDPQSAQDKPSIAVIYFENRTGDHNLDFWRTSLWSLFINDLSQSKYLRVLPEDRLFSIFGELGQLDAESFSSDTIQKVATRGDVAHILKGNYFKFGDVFRIDISVQDVKTGEILGSDSAQGSLASGDEIIPSLVDNLTPKIKEFLNLTAEEIDNDYDVFIGEITTRSSEAYKYFNEALEYFFKAEFLTSIQLLDEAIAIDPEFASAYRYAAYSSRNIGNNAAYKKYLIKAFELKERLPEKDRYMIEADYYSNSIETAEKSIQAYEKLLKLDSEDWSFNNMLGTTYLKLEDWDKAIKYTGVGVRNRSPGFFPYYNLSNAYMAKGMYEEAGDVWKVYIDNFPDHMEIHFSLAFNALYRGDYDTALKEAEKVSFLVSDLPWDSYLYAILYHCQGDLIKAEEAALKLTQSGFQVIQGNGYEALASLSLLKGQYEKSEEYIRRAIGLWEFLEELEWESRMYSFLASVLSKAGDSERALEACEAALNKGEQAGKLLVQILALHTKGLIHAERNSIDETLRIADDLKILIERGNNEKLIRHYDHLRGTIELQRNNLQEASENFEKALSLLPHQFQKDLEYNFRNAFFEDSTGQAYFMAQDLEKAREHCERITKLTTGRYFFGDIYVKSFFILAKISEQQGDTVQASDFYRKFLDFWKDADPGLPEVEEAKKRLAELRE